MLIVPSDTNSESDLLHSRKMEAVGTLAGGIAHDFNNMLQGILGAAEMLKRHPREDQRRHIGIIESASERAAELISQILAFSRRGDIAIRPVAIDTVVNDALKLIEPSLEKNLYFG